MSAVGTCEPWLAGVDDGVRALSPYEPGRPIEAVQREYGLRHVVKLASNENPAGPSPVALAAARASLDELGRYPDGNGTALKAALAAFHGLPAEAITLGNGSNDLLELVARLVLGPGRNAVVSEHAFAIYTLVAGACGAEVRTAPARPVGAAQAYGHDLAAMAAHIDAQTAVVFIANPNNPTGTWLTEAELVPFLDAVPASVLVVLDEAYADYVTVRDYPHGPALLERYPNLLVTRTFSKAYGLAALRVGYGLSAAPLADLLNRIRQPFNVNTVAQAAALAALGDQAHVVASRESNRAGMDQLEAGFARLGLPTLPSTGNFLCVEVGEGAARFQALLRRGIIVRPLAGYGLPRHLRVTVGLPAENEQLLEALATLA